MSCPLQHVSQHVSTVVHLSGQVSSMNIAHVGRTCDCLELPVILPMPDPPLHICTGAMMGPAALYTLSLVPLRHTLFAADCPHV